LVGFKSKFPHRQTPQSSESRLGFLPGSGIGIRELTAGPCLSLGPSGHRFFGPRASRAPGSCRRRKSGRRGMPLPRPNRTAAACTERCPFGTMGGSVRVTSHEPILRGLSTADPTTRASKAKAISVPSPSTFRTSHKGVSGSSGLQEDGRCNRPWGTVRSEGCVRCLLRTASRIEPACGRVGSRKHSSSSLVCVALNSTFCILQRALPCLVVSPRACLVSHRSTPQYWQRVTDAIDAAQAGGAPALLLTFRRSLPGARKPEQSGRSGLVPGWLRDGSRFRPGGPE
jgi:hypothetical protein